MPSPSPARLPDGAVEAAADALFQGGLLDEIAAADRERTLHLRNAQEDAHAAAETVLDAVAPLFAARERVLREALEEIARWSKPRALGRSEDELIDYMEAIYARADAALDASSSTEPERVPVLLERLTSDEFLVKVAASSVLDQPETIAAMAALGRDCHPDAEVLLLRRVLQVVADKLREENERG